MILVPLLRGEPVDDDQLPEHLDRVGRTVWFDCAQGADDSEVVAERWLRHGGLV